jgi:AraC-like DNA-binding protein
VSVVLSVDFHIYKAMHATTFPIYDIQYFQDGVKHFWLDELEGLLERCPGLEQPHLQDFYSLLWVEEGEGFLKLDRYQVRIDRAKVLVITPGAISHLDCTSITKGKLICFTDDFFSLRYNNNSLAQFSFLKSGAKPAIRIPPESLNRWDTLLGLLTQEYRQQRNDSLKVLRSYLNILLTELERQYDPSGAIKTRTINQEKIIAFEALIDQFYLQKKLPSEYAVLMHISANHLNKLCKKETGHTAGDLIRRRVNIEAQRLLHFTNLSINEIAIELGFEHSSYFITFFKKQNGLTPEQFRKSQNH